jgi:hypothetical protein
VPLERESAVHSPVLFNVPRRLIVKECRWSEQIQWTCSSYSAGYQVEGFKWCRWSGRAQCTLPSYSMGTTYEPLRSAAGAGESCGLSRLTQRGRLTNL